MDMNKFQLGLNIVLIIAIGALFYLYFGHGKERGIEPLSAKAGNVPMVNTTPGAFKIGYFETDSLDNNYKYEQDVRDELVAKEKSVKKQIDALRNEVGQRYNQMMQKGSALSQQEQMQMQKELEALNAQNSQKADRLNQSLGMERDMKLQQVRQRIQDYLKTFAKAQGYNFIIGTNASDNYYYKDSTQDITAQLLDGLNRSYADSKKGSK